MQLTIDEYLKDGAVPLAIWMLQKVIRTSRLLGRLAATKDQHEERIRTLESNVFGVVIHDDEEENKSHGHKHTATARAAKT